MATGAFHTYDLGLDAYRFFAGGEPPDANGKSPFRRNIERTEAGLNQDLGWSGRLLNGLGQLAPGLLVSGGVADLATAVPTIARLGGALGSTATGAAKMAAASYLSLDPHSGNIANLVDTFAPALSNPVTEALALHPGDSDATGRLKNAVGSIGFDLGLAGVLRGSVALSRAVRSGDKAATELATKELLDAQEHIETQAAAREADPRLDSSGVNDNAPSGLGTLANDNAALGLPPAAATQAAEPAPVNAPKPNPLSGTRELGGPDGPPEAVQVPEPSATGSDLVGGQKVADAMTAAQQGAVVPEPSLGDSARMFLDAGAAPRAADEAASTAAPGGTAARGGPSKPAFALPDVTPEVAASIAASARSDMEALVAHGGDWTAAIQDHEFGQGAGIPWQKLSQPDDVNVFMTRMVDALKPEFDGLKGGDVLSDARVNQMLAQRARLYNIDPSAMMGRLAAAGSHAAEMAANMEASTLIASRVNHDIAALAARIDADDLAAYGGDLQAAHADLARRVAVFQAAYGAAQSMKSNAARTLRRMRTEFRVDPEMLNALQDVDPAMLAKTVASLKGDPAKLAKLGPGLARRLTDNLGFLMVSNLLSRPETHFVGLMTNSAQMLMRPAERIIGSFAMGNKGASVREQAFRQYYFMGASIMDGFRSAARAFVEGDSRIAPHADPVRNLTAAQMDGPVPIPYRPGDGVAVNTYNTIMAAFGPKLWQAVSIGPRLLGTVDEMNKAITYRSMVMAKAHMEGAAQIRAAGLDGPEAKQALAEFIKQRMGAAFDDAGYATDQAAIQEAKTATFNQDLEGKFSKWMVSGVQAMPALRFFVPFVKGPANVLRYGWRLTPGLNLLQREFRDAYFGRMGPEAQTQAIGQMGLAQGFLGSAAYLASEGHITGGGPNDPQARAQLMATGWRPYSFVIHTGGKTRYLNFGKYDPVALPFGVVADLYQIAHHSKAEDGFMSSVLAITMSVAKSLSNKGYLSSAVNALDTFSSDNEQKWSRLGGTEAANLIPFASGQRFVTSTITDGYLRDARSWTDQIMAQTPGLSDKLPPKRNWLGEPVHQAPMLYSSAKDNLVDQEVQRLILETGKENSRGAVANPSPSIGTGADLRTIKLADGRDAYDRYQELAGQPAPDSPTLRSVMNDIMSTEAYRDAPDGPSNSAGTKLSMLEGPKSQYREAAKRFISADPNVAAALHKAATDVAGASATKRQDPNGARGQAKVLQNLGKGFGVDLGLAQP